MHRLQSEAPVGVETRIGEGITSSSPRNEGCKSDFESARKQNEPLRRSRTIVSSFRHTTSNCQPDRLLGHVAAATTHCYESGATTFTPNRRRSFRMNPHNRICLRLESSFKATTPSRLDLVLRQHDTKSQLPSCLRRGGQLTRSASPAPSRRTYRRSQRMCTIAPRSGEGRSCREQ